MLYHIDVISYGRAWLHYGLTIAALCDRLLESLTTVTENENENDTFVNIHEYMHMASADRCEGI